MEKFCAHCKEKFESTNHFMKYCSEICREKQANKKLNSKWFTSSPREYAPIPLDQAERFHSGHAYKKSEPKGLKRFRAMRG